MNNSSICYAGIGSRETPSDILEIMTEFAHQAYRHGRHLVTGGAIGADQAFMSGVLDPAFMTVYYAEDSTFESKKAAAYFHPAWDRCSEYARKLHGRNMMILLGKELKSPVSYVICWTKGGLPVGGTGQALRAAQHYNIPVFNLYFDEVVFKVKKNIEKWRKS